MIGKLLAMAAVFSAYGSGQAPTQKMVDLSVRVVGAVERGGKMQPASVGGGFLLDAKHVAATDACCGKTPDGQQKTAVVISGQNGVAAQPVWSGAGGIVILETKDPIQTGGPTLAPLKFTQQNQAAYTVVFPKDGAPTVSENQIQSAFKPEGMESQVYKATPPAEGMLPGGALFDGCGQVVGINVLSNKGVQVALAIDALSPGLKKTGVQVTVADKRCGGAAQTSSSDNGGDKGGRKDDETRWRWPQGSEWIGVGIIGGLLALALRRDTRQQMARALTTRRPIPEYSYSAAPMMMGARGKPVLKGIAGQYAGASIALEQRPSVLGRDQHAANLVFESDSVSKLHCSVQWDAARAVLVLEDLGSTNGTFLANGEKLTPGQPRDMRPGEAFYLGDLRNQFEVRMED